MQTIGQCHYRLITDYRCKRKQQCKKVQRHRDRVLSILAATLWCEICEAMLLQLLFMDI